MADCFCGCGRSVPFGRRRFTNMYGGRVTSDVAMLRGARERAPELAAGTDVPQLIDEGDAYRLLLARMVHGDASRKDLDTDALKVWWQRMQPYREGMIKAGAELEGGIRGGRNAEIALTGVRAQATLVRVEDTGTTVNASPRVRLVFAAAPPGGPPVEIAIDRTVSRVAIPQPGIVVPVAYDPEDPQGRHTFEEDDLVAALAAGPPSPAAVAPDPVDALARLQALHAAGGLTDAEFAAAKARVIDTLQGAPTARLDGPPGP
jgi:hypothetical protein